MKITTGYIKIHRQLLGHATWENPQLLKVWVWVLLKAHWKNGYSQIFRGTKFDVKRGQFLTGRTRGAQECHMAESTFWWCLTKLQEFGQILIESERKKTLVTVINYETYQGGNLGEEPNVDESLTTISKQKKSTGRAKPEVVAEAVAYFEDNRSNRDEAEKFFDHFESNGWRVGGKSPMKDWKAGARNWIKNVSKYGGNTRATRKVENSPSRIIISCGECKTSHDSTKLCPKCNPILTGNRQTAVDAIRKLAEGMKVK